MATKTKRSRPILRRVEASLGVPIANLVEKIELKSSKLVGPKKVFLPNAKISMHYYEREAVGDAVNNQTILLLHGFGMHGREFCSFLRQVNLPETIRILVPEMIGHGEDLKRVRSEGVQAFQQPDAMTILNATSEFLDIVKAGPNCNALGTSLGGALLYFLKQKRPDIIQNTVLVAPALPHFLTDSFLGGLIQGSHRFMDFQSREDVKHLFRDILWTDPSRRFEKGSKHRTKTNPFSPVGYEVIYRLTLRDVPDGHFKALQDKLIVETKSSENSEETNSFNITKDVDRDAPRLVLWPEEDQICSLEKGRAFFGPAMEAGTTIFRTIPECGHVFDVQGTSIYDIIGPMVTPFLLDFKT